MFQVIGNLVSESGFEDNAFEASVCLSGGIIGIMTRSPYDRDWFVHNIISEALEKLLSTLFLCEVSFKIYFISVILKYYL